MKIAYVTTYDARDVEKWSGLGYNISEALKRQNAELTYVDNIAAAPNIYKKAKAKLYSAFGNKYDATRSVIASKRMAREVEKKIHPDADIIFSPSSTPIAFVNSDKPKVFYTDATFAGMLDFYKDFTKLCSETIKAGNIIEQQALSNCDIAIYASEWAAKTAMQYYNVPASKIKVVPFGANVECNRTIETIRESVNHRSKSKCKILFIGVDWKRKGGPMVLEVIEKLNQKGIEAELHVVGVKDLPSKNLPPYIINYGFISKASKEGRDQLNELFSSSHFLFIPSQAEAFGIVFCEASSFGVPSISNSVGGITTAIRNNINGQTFAIGTEVDIYVKYIKNTFENQELYKEISYSSFHEYKNRLNWDSSGKAIKALLNQLV